MLEAERLSGSDLLTIQRQETQRLTLGLDATPTLEEADALADEPEAWTLRRVHRDGSARIVACIGIVETFPGVQGVAWAVLAAGIGADHLALTRFARAMLARSMSAGGLQRIEAIAKPGREAEWAKLCGLAPVHLLRKFGAASETYFLCERLSDDGATLQQEQR